MFDHAPNNRQQERRWVPFVMTKLTGPAGVGPRSAKSPQAVGRTALTARLSGHDGRWAVVLFMQGSGITVTATSSDSDKMKCWWWQRFSVFTPVTDTVFLKTIGHRRCAPSESRWIATPDHFLGQRSTCLRHSHRFEQGGADAVGFMARVTRRLWMTLRTRKGAVGISYFSTMRRNIRQPEYLSVFKYTA